MDFSLNEEQQMIVKTTRDFVRKELYPHEKEVEETGVLREDLHRELKAKAIDAGSVCGQHAGRGGRRGTRYGHLGAVREGARPHQLRRCTTSCVGRPSNILLACEGEQRERYLLPTVRGERTECLAMTEPRRGIGPARHEDPAVESGGDFVINGTKHFISHADQSDYVILFAASGEEASARGTRKKITAFLIDMGTPGFEVRPGYKNVSHRGYTNSILRIQRLPRAEERRAGRGAPRLRGRQRRGWAPRACRWRATCLGRAERALDLAKQWAVDRVQFGQQIGKFQGVSFKLADMAVELRAAELLVLEAAWKRDQKTATDMDMAMAKLKATEMLAMVADEALQIHGGMGLMSDLPLERIWRDARIERIWDGTSEVQRHIISRALLRPLGG